LTPWRYLAGLTGGRYILWCYFIWWAVVAVQYFDPSPRVWLTALGLSVIVGIALTLNAKSGMPGTRLQPWPTLRFFITPFCVSSFAALVKDRGFFLIFSPRREEMLAAAGMCAVLGALAIVARKTLPAAVPTS